MPRTWVVVVAALVLVASRRPQAAASSMLVSPTQTGETGLVFLPTTQVLEPWKFSAGISENGELGDSTPGSVNTLWYTQFSLGVGLLPNLEFTTYLPYVQFERDVPSNRHTDDIGGWRMGLKYRLLDEDDGAPVSFALLGALVLGTGHNNFPAILNRNTVFGQRETYELMGILDKRLWTTTTGADATLTLNAGGLFFDKPPSFAVENQSLQFQRRYRGLEATFDNPFEFGVGLRVPVLRIRDINMDFLSEYRGNTGVVQQLHGALPTWLFTGARLQASNGLAFQGGPDFGLSGFLDPYRFVIGLSYAMQPAQVGPAPTAPPLPPAAAAPSAPAAKKKIVLRGVQFDFNQSTIRADARPILQASADILKDNPGIHIVVVGHTDSTGTEQYNQRLSVRRATAVRDYLERLGVAAKRMTIQGRGEQQPVASNATEEGRAQNRRVELLVQP
jgi:outer membrane protein OmpA-like peptidoglycan-associated protein